MTNPIPDGFHTLTPHITVKDSAKTIEFCKAAFGAEEIARMDGTNAMTNYDRVLDRALRVIATGTNGPESEQPRPRGSCADRGTAAEIWSRSFASRASLPRDSASNGSSRARSIARGYRDAGRPGSSAPLR